MFTQCPECKIAFRVTAEVLKKATGKARCGGCGIAFDALLFLSDDMPESAPRSQPSERVPELTSETEHESRISRPRTMSTEQSAALLKTLDELAGSDIRIEDTGVEWRVLDLDTDVGELESEQEQDDKASSVISTGSMKFVIEGDEQDAVEESPTADLSEVFESEAAPPIHTGLDESGGKTVDENPEDTQDPGDEFLIDTPDQVGAAESLVDSGQHPESEVMRFDDNTPLPDDFESEDGSFVVPQPPEPLVEIEEQVAEAENNQVDLALGDPEEWEQLLGEFDESVAEDQESAPQDAGEDPFDEAPEAVDDGAASEDVAETPPDVDTQFAIQAEAMGIDLSGLHRSIDEASAIDTLEPDERDDGADEASGLAVSEDLEREDVLDDATKLAGTAESAEGWEEEDASLELADADEDIDDDDEALAEYVADVIESVDDADAEQPGEDQDEYDPDDGDSDALPQEADPLPADFEQDEEGASVDEDLIAAAFVSEAAQLTLDVDVSAEQDEEGASDASDGHYVPAQTEEEMTINMMIDQDFMRLAAEGEEVFTPAMAEDRADLDDNQNVETIVMEGESVRSALGRKQHATDAAAVLKRFDDARFMEDAGKTKGPGRRGGRRETDPPSYGVIAGIIGLTLLFVGQILHQNREALATVPAFNQLAGPVYRMTGSPLTPAWDITGWRFEVSKGSTDENDELLTIYSRIGNKSDQALPYPLVHVSLTDRFEEIIGSKVLEPGEYLAGNANPRRAVLPGNSFNAVISIETPAREVTGFKLNVCYRLSSGLLRCAIENFK